MNCCFAVLEKEALLSVEGPDALQFLQGQLTCDTRKLDIHRALPGLYCTPQGRVICDVLLVQLATDRIGMRLRRDLRDASAALLAKYIVFSRARLQAEADDWAVLGCWGTDAGAALGETFGTLPQGLYASAGNGASLLVQTDAGGEMFECLLPLADAETILEKLARVAAPAAATGWEARQVVAGAARIEAATSGEFIPQMLNYDLSGHISFNKGCYTGQEVVARMHYRGKPKRRLHLATLPAAGERGEAPAPGARLVTVDGQNAGTVVNAVPDSAGPWQLLVTATHQGVEQGLRLEDTSGPLLQIGELPYPVPQ